MKPERPYTERDQLLKRWLTGNVRRQEERELETMAQDDPFLAEAMEGYQAMPDGEHLESITNLKAKLRNRTEAKRRGGGFYLMRVAAVGAVLLAAWMVFNQFENGDTAEAPISQAEKIAPESEPETVEKSFKEEANTATETISATQEQGEPEEGQGFVLNFETPKTPEVEDGIPQNAIEIKKKVERSDKLASVSREDLATVESAPKRKQEVQKALDVVTYNPNTPAPNSTNETSTPMPEPIEGLTFDDESIPPYEAPEENESTAPVVYKVVGKVTNDFGEPLTGARVVVDGAQRGTVTDSDGLFSIETEATEPNLKVSYLGYEDQSLAVSEKDFVNVQMHETESAFMEDITVGSAERKKSSVAPPQPEGGFSKLEKYIRKNRIRPVDNQEVKGEVRLRFHIGEDGVPTDFEILESLGEAYDEEAKRLLREGPRWGGDKNEKVTYSISF